MAPIYDTLDPVHSTRAYPTAYELVHRPQIVRRRDAMITQGALADIRRQAARLPRDSEARLRLEDDFFTALHHTQRYAFEARVMGFRLPG